MKGEFQENKKKNNQTWAWTISRRMSQVFQSRILIQRNDPIFEEDKDQNWKHEYGGKLFFMFTEMFCF